MALSSGFRSKAAALGLGALALTGTAHADDQARNVTPVSVTDVQPASTVRAIDRVNMPTRDARGEGVGFGEVAAIAASERYVLFKFHSNDPAIIAEVNDDLRTLVMNGYDDIAFLLADGPNGFDNSAEIYVWATDGKPSATLTNVGGNGTGSGIRDTIKAVYPPSWKPTASLSDPAADLH